jgi:hypothetical protein
MKKITYFVGALLVAALVTVVMAKANSTYSVDNETTVNIGDVQFNVPGGTNAHIVAGPSNTFMVMLPALL